MHKHVLWAAALLSSLLPGVLPAEPDPVRSFDDSVITPRHYPDWFKDRFLDLAADLDEALQADRQGLFLFFDTEGCAYCAAFVKHSLGDPAIKQRLQRHFDAIGLDIFQDDELVDFAGKSQAAKDFAKQQGTLASPTLLFVGSGGEVLYRGVGYYTPERFRLVLDYLSDDRYRTMTFKSFLAQHESEAEPATAGQLTEDPLFAQPPYMPDRRMPSSLPLLVIFEKGNCIDCRNFYQQVIGHPPVRELLSRFEVVQLDIRDSETALVTPDGIRTSPAAWADSRQITDPPALLFFSRQGAEVLRFESLVLQQRMERALM